MAVGPAAPTIVWTAPVGGITYGATLSGILNASAVSGSTSVAGTFTYTATLAGGSAVAVTAATVLGAGSYTITATFTPTDTTIYASTSASIALTVAKATPALALTSSAASVGVGSAVTFTATLTSSAGTPSGSVSFYDGTTLLGTGTLAMGVATYTTTNLPVGALSITAVYGGDTNFSALTSAGLTESVLTSFTVTAPTTPVPVAPGGAAIIDLTIPPLGGAFDSVVTLSASGLPPGATATFNPPTVTPGSAGAPTVMTIQLATLAAGIPAATFLPTTFLPTGDFRWRRSAWVLSCLARCWDASAFQKDWRWFWRWRVWESRRCCSPGAGAVSQILPRRPPETTRLRSRERADRSRPRRR